MGEIEFDKNFSASNSLTVKFFGSKISDLVDRIPVGDSGDAVGNIDSAYQYGIDIDTTLKGDLWGYHGTELELQLTLRDSKVDDPLTGVSRRLNNDEKYFWGINFRHDIPATEWAYGFSISQERDARNYRLDNISLFEFSRPRSNVFIENKDIFGLKVTASFLNVFNGTDDFSREFFTDRRDLGMLDFTEARSRNFDVYFNLDISSTF